jgi:alkylated DNA repair dioxygenase AlkB
MEVVPAGLTFNQDVLDSSDIRLVYSFIESLEFKPADIFRGLTREVVQFGLLYDYRTRTCNFGTTPFPHVLNLLATNIREGGPFNQCIVNKYKKGERVTSHIDAPCFGDTIGCFTFGKGADVIFTKGDISYTVSTTDNSLYVITGESRYKWKHQIIPLQSGVRYSITFRSVHF